MSKVAVIGSGFVGRAWALSFARGGHEVALWDQDPQAAAKAFACVEELLPDLEDNDLLNGATTRAIALRIRPAATQEAALEGAVHVQESRREDVEVKREVFARLDAAAGGASLVVHGPVRDEQPKRAGRGPRTRRAPPKRFIRAFSLRLNSGSTGAGQ